MKVAKDQYGTPTLASDLAAAAFTLADRGRAGLFHAAGPDFISRYEFALRAAKTLGLPSDKIAPATTQALSQRAPRPLKGGLLSDKILRALPFGFFGVDEGVRIFREQWQK